MTQKRNQSKKLSRKKLFTSVAVLAALFVACLTAFMLIYKKTPAPPKFTGAVEHISTGNVGQYSALSIIAQDRGYFRDNGLEVTMKDYISGPAAITDLLAGKIDTATAADFVGVSNSFKGEDLKILTTQTRAFSFFLVVRSDHNIKAPVDLKGKRIGVTQKTAGEFYLGQYLIFNRLRLEDVKVTYGNPAELVELMVNGDLDAAVTFEPHISAIQKQIGKNVSVADPVARAHSNWRLIIS